MSRAAILRRVIKSVEGAIERDRDHRVRVTRDYCAGEFDERVFGGLYHRLALLLAISALCAALCGCSGCAVPGGFTPSDDPPPYTVEAR